MTKERDAKGHELYRCPVEGATLGPVVQAICDWGEEHLSDRIV